ncbi:integral membrane sensor signal transduction histidine kinase [Leptolyngbya sp. Heron Island J]|uniref:histidine kinase n=1 Tax=Leptolyngbya sp. Heron Island J TaxID=1385935 RepID=UPI0003B9E5CC|nr:histidine kinase dimerization/phosphoacceptor domain-containing protein [Leptolyngbya sp. Heron Island J]ESA33344.1 integral membrane sensor signal transduction histidine kinase [Leptolyngbya sp. Heron Island J]
MTHPELKHYSARGADLVAIAERNRLVRDLHDSLGHHLAAINIQLEKANAYRRRDPNRASREFLTGWCIPLNQQQHNSL